MTRLSAIQLTSEPDVESNLRQIDALIDELVKSYQDEHHIVALPEACLYFGGKDNEQLFLVEASASNEMINALAAMATKHRIYLVAGTIPFPCEIEGKFTASSFVFSPKGEVLNHYQKMHLFDVEVNDGTKRYAESKYTNAGLSAAVTPIGDVILGQTVCYDVRFPELFRDTRSLGADIITVPAAFTRVTGDAHWEILLRARAIENQVYIVAPAQEGIHANGRETWGHSMIVSPWGEVLCELATGVGWITAEVDQSLLHQVRQNIPVESHNQYKVIKKSS